MPQNSDIFAIATVNKNNKQNYKKTSEELSFKYFGIHTKINVMNNN